jgi:hypothetical protein
LFPNCIPSAGWRHIFDGIVKWGLCSLPFFVPWLAQLKTWNKFFRNYMTELTEQLENSGFNAVAEMLKKIHFTTFAEWR